MTPIQSDTFGGHFPVLALDGSLNTFSVAKSSNIAPDLQDVAWWQLDLGGYYRVSQVDVTSSPYSYCKSTSCLSPLFLALEMINSTVYIYTNI